MKKHRSDLAKYAVVAGQGKEKNVTLPSNFSPSSFTVAAFENFDRLDKNTLSGNASVHNTGVFVFQEELDKPLRKPLKSEVPLRNVTTLKRLPCPQRIEHTKTKNSELQVSFSVDKEVFLSKKKIQDHELTKFIMSCVRFQNPDTYCFNQFGQEMR